MNLEERKNELEKKLLETEENLHEKAKLSIKYLRLDVERYFILIGQIKEIKFLIENNKDECSECKEKFTELVLRSNKGLICVTCFEGIKK